MPIKFSSDALDRYLSIITINWFSHNDDPPDDMEDYLPFVESIKYHAAQHNDLDDLQQVLAYALVTPNFDYARFAGDRYPYDADEIREIMQFIYHTLWPDAALPIQAPDVTLVDTPAEAWWASRSGQAPANP